MMKLRPSLKNVSLFILFLLSLPSFARATELSLSCPHGQISFTVEVARTPAECAKGLMHREKLGDEEGMLFLFPETGPKAMWMKNTPLPLDMIFINPQGEIVALKENTTPYSLDIIGPVENTAQVLEVKGGTVKKQGISKDCGVSVKD